VFNINKIENKEKVKYSIKNNNSEDSVVFLATKNQIKANINSRRNFRLTETKRCIV
jgi:hypothetical protein